MGGKQFQRWDICKMTKEKVVEKYQDSLGKELGVTQAWVGSEEALKQLEEGRLKGQELSQVVDGIWDTLVDAMHSAANQAVGRLKFNSNTPRGFWTEDLEVEWDQIQNEKADLQQAILSGSQSNGHLRAGSQQLAAKQCVYREHLRGCHTAMFREAVDKLGRPENQSALM